MDYYYTDSQNQSKGPISEEELRAMVAAGTLNASTMVCQVGAQQWVSIGTLVPTAAPPPPVAGKKTEPLAIWSFVLSLLGLACCGFLVMNIGAVVCGHLALSKFKKDPELGGKGLALAGVIIGYLGILSAILYWCLFGASAVAQALHQAQ